MSRIKFICEPAILTAFANCSEDTFMGKLPSYPSPKPTLTLTSHLWQNVDLGEGWVDNSQD